jgi:hypothetical protein
MIKNGAANSNDNGSFRHTDPPRLGRLIEDHRFGFLTFVKPQQWPTPKNKSSDLAILIP